MASPLASPGRRPIAKKLTFPSPAVGGRKRERTSGMGSGGSVRMVGSGPFSEARQRKTLRSTAFEDSENTQPDLVQKAATVTASPEDDSHASAAARRLLFQLSPSGPTLVSLAVSKSSKLLKKASPTQDVFAELEKLSISSASKNKSISRKRSAMTPTRTSRLGGAALRVNTVSNSAEDASRDSAKRIRNTQGSGMSILSKMAPMRMTTSTTSSSYIAGGSTRMRPSNAAPSDAPVSTQNQPKIRLGVEHIVAWEKKTGLSWYKLSKSDKETELRILKENLRN